MTPDEIKAVIAQFDNGSKRHHHKLIRTLAQQLLKVSLENVLLKTMVPDVREVHLTACEEEAA